MAGEDDVGLIHCGDGVLVVPLDDAGNVLLAVERSAAFDRELLLLVGGSVEPGEPLEETANRELPGGTGWRAEQIDFLGEVRPFKYLTSRQFVFLARGLTPSKLDGDELYPIATRTIPLDSFISLCLSGESFDARASPVCVRRWGSCSTQPYNSWHEIWYIPEDTVSRPRSGPWRRRPSYAHLTTDTPFGPHTLLPPTRAAMSSRISLPAAECALWHDDRRYAADRRGTSRRRDRGVWADPIKVADGLTLVITNQDGVQPMAHSIELIELLSHLSGAIGSAGWRSSGATSSSRTRRHMSRC